MPISTLQLISTSFGFVVAGALLLAGLAKSTDHRQTAASFADLGLPFAKRLASIVPVLEMVIAAFIVLQGWFASLIGAALLLVFTVFLLFRLRSGDPISCACFGSASTKPVTYLTIVRNVLLTGAALGAALGMRNVSVAELDARTRVLAVTVAGTIALISALIIGLLSIRDTIGSVFSQSPQPQHLGSGE